MRFFNTNIFKKILAATLILALVVPAFSSAMVGVSMPVEPQAPDLKPNTYSIGPQVPLVDPHPFWVNFFDTTVSTNPTLPDGWAKNVDSKMNEYSYRGFIIPNVLIVVDEYYFYVAPRDYWKYSIEDIKIQISMYAYLWNFDSGFCRISIKNFDTNQWELLKSNAETQDHNLVWYRFDKDNLLHSDNLEAYIDNEGRAEIQIHSENYGWWQPILFWSVYWPPGVTVGIDVMTMEVLFDNTPDTTPPTVAITNLDNDDSVRGVQTIMAVANDNIGLESIDLYINGLLRASKTLDGSGGVDASLSYDWDTQGLAERDYEIKVVATDNAGLTTEEVIRVTVDNKAQKIGVFFWSSEFSIEAINYFADVLIAEGYTKFYMYQDYKNKVYSINSLEPVFQEIDSREGESDTVFLYIWGHGDGSLQPDYSHTYLYHDPNELFPASTPSHHVRKCMDLLEARRKGILVESCYAGHYIDDFDDSPYTVITSSDYDSLAAGELNGRPYFSTWFFYGVSLGYNSLYAFAAAASMTSNQDPLYLSNSDYIFFS